MAVLTTNQYGSIVFGANKFTTPQDIAEFFQASYNEHKTDNPRFVVKLYQVIQHLNNDLNYIIEREVNNNPERIKVFGVTQTEPETISDMGAMILGSEPFNPLHFESFPAKVLGFDFSGTISLNKINAVEQGFELFSQSTQDNEPPERNNLNTTQKAQIVVLNEIGFFNLPVFENIPLEQRGEFLSRLLNMNFDNAKDYWGNLFDRSMQSTKSPYNKSSVKRAKEILSIITPQKIS